MRMSRRVVVTLMGVVVAAAGLAVAATLGARDRLWQPARHEFRIRCDSGCDSIGSAIVEPHGTVVVYAQPRVDDDITQWAGCLDQVLRCMADTLSRACVERSSCPTSCKARYAAATRATTDSLALLTVFESIFVGDSAYCRPR
jgi:hypothetical protein